jgi:hypothetical protein
VRSLHRAKEEELPKVPPLFARAGKPDRSFEAPAAKTEAQS